MKKIIVIVYVGWLIVLVSMSDMLAQNLVPNPSFETATSCPSNNTFTVATWYSINTASPDYFNPCGSRWTIPGASVLYGPQDAHTGSSFVGIGWYSLGGGWYEYIQVMLTSPLQAGEAYTISMWVGLADQVKKASDDLGIYISNDQFKSTSSIQPSIPTRPANFGIFTMLTPQIKFADGNFITDVVNWTELSASYTVIGGEKVITIGCFEPWATTGTFLANAAASTDKCYYYIDDVSVEKPTAALPIELLSCEVLTNKENQAILHWKIASERNACYYKVQRSVNGIGFQTIGKASAKGNSDVITEYTYTDTKLPDGVSYYRLKQTDCNRASSYTKTVSVNSVETDIVVYPNPVLDELKIHFSEKANTPASII